MLGGFRQRVSTANAPLYGGFLNRTVALLMPNWVARRSKRFQVIVLYELQISDATLFGYVAEFCKYRYKPILSLDSE